MGISLPTVDRWIRDGCPVKQRGTKGVAWEFSLPDVVAWWGNRQREAAGGDAKADEAELKRRKLAAETAKSELELAQARALVAPIREFEIAHAKRMAVIRQSVLNVVGRSVMQLLGCRDEAEFRSKLRAELVLALEQAAADPIDVSEDEEDEEDDTA